MRAYIMNYLAVFNRRIMPSTTFLMLDRCLQFFDDCSSFTEQQWL